MSLKPSLVYSTPIIDLVWIPGNTGCVCVPPSVSRCLEGDRLYDVCHALTLASRSEQVALSPVREIAGVGRAWSRRPGSYKES